MAAPLEEETGRLIYVCAGAGAGRARFPLRTTQCISFSGSCLVGDDEEIVRRHIRVCHDICHAAVMFEDQEEVLRKYAAAGIQVGKIQVSAALAMNLGFVRAAGR